MSATDRIRRSAERARSNRRRSKEGLPDEYVMLEPDAAEALADLADETRRFLACSDGADPRFESLARDALARLDGEDGDG